MPDIDLKIRSSFTDDGAKKGLTETEQGVKNVSEALARASKATQDYAAVADSGLQGVDVALVAAKGSVEGLATAIEKSKAIGAPVDPGAVSQLEALRAVLSKTKPSLDDHSKSTTGASKATAEFKALIPLASRELGPFGSALNQLSKSNNEWIAGLAKGLLPLAAIGGALALASKAFDGLSERGLEVPTATGVAGKALDALAVALGGTSKATQEMIGAFQDAQKDTANLSASTTAFRTGLDLLRSTASQTGIGFKELSEGLRSQEFTTISEATEKAAGQINQFNKALNAVRVSSPETAARLAADFQSIVTDISHGVEGSNQALTALIGRTQDAAKATDDAAKAIKEAYGGGKAGDEAVKGAAALAGQVGALTQKLDASKAAGLSDADALGVLKGEAAAVSQGMDKFGAGLLILNKNTFDHAAAIANASQKYSAFQQAVRDFQNAAVAESITVQQITVQMAVHNKSISDSQLAYTALKPVIDSQITALQNQLHSQGNLNVEQAAHLGQLLKLREQYDTLDPAMKKIGDGYGAQARALGDLGKRLEDTTKSYEKQRVEIIKSADQQVKDATRASSAVAASVDSELADLSRLARDGTISQSDYAAKVADAQNRKVDAWRDAQGKIDTAQSDETDKLEELQKGYEESTAEIKRILGEQGQTVAAAVTKHAELATQAKVTSADLVIEANRHADLAVTLGKSFGSTDKVLKDMAKDDGGIGQVKKGLSDVIEIADTLGQKLDVVVGKLGQISISNAGTATGAGGGADAGAGASPGSEGG